MLNQLYTNLKSPPQLLINNIHSRDGSYCVFYK